MRFSGRRSTECHEIFAVEAHHGDSGAASGTVSPPLSVGDDGTASVLKDSGRNLGNYSTVHIPLRETKGGAMARA